MVVTPSERETASPRHVAIEVGDLVVRRHNDKRSRDAGIVVKRANTIGGYAGFNVVFAIAGRVQDPAFFYGFELEHA